MPLTSEEKIDPSMKTIYLGLFSMICCLWPCGLIAVILGIQVRQIEYLLIHVHMHEIYYSELSVPISKPYKKKETS